MVFQQEGSLIYFPSLNHVTGINLLSCVCIHKRRGGLVNQNECPRKSCLRKVVLQRATRDKQLVLNSSSPAIRVGIYWEKTENSFAAEAERNMSLMGRVTST